MVMEQTQPEQSSSPAISQPSMFTSEGRAEANGRFQAARDEMEAAVIVSSDTLLTDETPTEETVRTAQRLTGEILWLSQRTRPDVAFTACVLAAQHQGTATSHPH